MYCLFANKGNYNSSNIEHTRSNSLKIDSGLSEEVNLRDKVNDVAQHFKDVCVVKTEIAVPKKRIRKGFVCTPLVEIRRVRRVEKRVPKKNIRI